MTTNTIGKMVFSAVGVLCAVCNDCPEGRPVQNLGVGIMVTMIMVFVLDKLTTNEEGKVT